MIEREIYDRFIRSKSKPRIVRGLRRVFASCIVVLIGLAILLLYVLSWPILELTAIELVGYFAAVVVNLWALWFVSSLARVIGAIIRDIKRANDE